MIRQGNKTLRADNARFDNRDSTVTAFGNVLFSTDALELKSAEATYQLRNDRGMVKDAKYTLTQGLGYGKSRQLIQQGKNKTLLKQATFSTCPPNHRSWHLTSSDISLDHVKQEGVAHNVIFKAGNIPVLYTPYFSFPLNDDRKSGFLTPGYRISDRSGNIISLPYYLNLAPNFDLTLTPNIITRRGLKLDTEFRYLTQKDEGEIRFEFLPGDNVANDDNRSLISIRQHTKISPNTRLSINATDVSDKDYFDDFSNTLVGSSIAALERRIDVTRSGKDWFFNTSLQDYKILDSNNAPYSRLPELRFHYQPGKKVGDTQYFFETELVNFQKDDDVTGVRLDLNSIISKRYEKPAWYIEPSVQLRHTQYSLDKTTGAQSSAPSRTLPTISLDTGLFFERKLATRNKIQTLEPRLFYTYTPFKDQSQIPVFDAAATSFSTSTRLFAKNRFTGKDRIGDTNQLTVALTTRLLDTDRGHELLSASIGQIFFFDDRKVTLPGESIDDNGTSELALELAGELNDHTRIITSTYWDPEKQKTTSTEARLHYQDKHKRRINLAYRNLDQELEQAEVSFSTPLSDNWSLVGKLDRDIKNDRNLEALGGVEYANCCWKVRLVGRRFLTADNTTYDTIPFIEFELKGLGRLGTGATDLLEEQIYGYKN